METITDLVGSGKEVVAYVIGAAGMVGAWVTARFKWWKAQTKLVRVVTAVGGFLVFAFAMSLITAPFT